jgi:hypothetical protein
VVQLAGAAHRHQPDHLRTREWMWQDSGVDYRGLHAAVATQGVHHTETVVARHQVGERGKIGHGRTSFQPWAG